MKPLLLAGVLLSLDPVVLRHDKTDAEALAPTGLPLEGVGAPGDSGGPAFIEENGRLFIAGVSSASMNGKPGSYRVVDVYTRISSYVAWIEGLMRDAPDARQFDLSGSAGGPSYATAR